MLIAILNVILFSSLNIKNNVINKLSKLTYGAYIIHIYFIFKCNDIINLNSTYNNKYYCLFDILFVLLVFILSLLTEFLRIKIVKLIKKLIVKTKKFL